MIYFGDLTKDGLTEIIEDSKSHIIFSKSSLRIDSDSVTIEMKFEEKNEFFQNFLKEKIFEEKEGFIFY